jgi:uncharacterized membrane protein
MAKTATFGVLHLVTSFSVTYTLTGSMTIAGVVTFVEPLVNTVMHYFFDRYWDHPGAERIRRTVKRASTRITSRTAPQVDHFSTKARAIT